MRITQIKNCMSTSMLAATVQDAISESRFTANVTCTNRSIRIMDVRLRAKKLYCGNHPAACENTGAKHKKLNYLEGADWVEFNDMVNTLLDIRKIGANVFTAVCVIRKGDFRRVNYGMDNTGRIAQWNKAGGAGDYVNYTQWKAPASEFPIGTPGVYQAIGYNTIG